MSRAATDEPATDPHAEPDGPKPPTAPTYL